MHFIILQLLNILKHLLIHFLFVLKENPIFKKSLNERGGIVLVPNLETALEIADEFAPEHLCLSVAQPERWSQKVANAGCLFLGERSCEVLGDYICGPNHILPTGGTARFASPLNVLDFVRIMSVVNLDDQTSTILSSPAAHLARAEQLDGHASAAEARALNPQD